MRQTYKLSLVLGLAMLAMGAIEATAQAENQVLISSQALTEGPWTWSERAIRIAHQEMQERAPVMPRGSSVLAFRLKYHTKNLAGEPVIASGLLRLRSDLLHSDTPLPLISYQHSTRVLRTDSPSTSFVDPEGMGGVLFFASRGFVWAMPDYLGLGLNKDPQSYLHAHGQAVVCSDFLLAVREWAAAQNLKIKNDIIVMGYSQGGHATLALQKYLESPENRTKFKVKASFAMAGPYSVAGVGLEQALKSKSSSQLLFVALAFYGLSFDPSLHIEMKAIINAQYENVLPKMFSGEVGFNEAAGMLPKNAEEFFTTSFLTEVIVSQANHPTLQALKAQDVVDFLAKAPVYLLHAPNDKVVLYENSTLAEKYLKARGSRVELIPLGEELDHVSAALPAFSEAAKIIVREKY